MRKTFRKLSFFIYNRFKLLWIFFTIFLLIITSYINWHININNFFTLVANTANKIALNIDTRINGMFENSYNIPFYEKKNITCKEDIDPYLQNIIINHPQISGLVIKDKKHHLICSTLPHNQNFLLESNIPQTILGPLKVSMFTRPVYAIQRQINNYQVEIIIIEPVLHNTLHSTNVGISSITLFDEHLQKKFINLSQPRNHSWLYNKFIKAQSPIVSQKIFATIKLKSLDGVLLTVIEDGQTVFDALWYRQLLLTIDILIISIVLYFLIKKLLIKHYSLHGAIKSAIKSRQFYPVYQPLFDTKSNTFTGAEVLLRWQDNYNQIITPEFFIEVAEDTGLIVPITIQIIETTFKESYEILKAFPKFYFSFNICAAHFTDDKFFNQFYKLKEHYSISPNQILFEITERDLLDKDNEIYFKKMQELRELGYSLALDDYGTGHSSISYLQYFPFNYLKIDKIFIQAIGTKAITETLNDAIIHLAKRMNLTIIAEGVETKEQVNYLMQNEVQFLQGWYFSRALSIEQLIDLLQGEK